jgi:TRAP-type C4-dicarboxylate transport system substrate-binding protein
MQKIKRTIYGLFIFTLTSFNCATVSSTEIIKVVVIDGYPSKAMWVQEFSTFFIPEVDKQLAKTGNYKMAWQESYGGSIVKTKGVLEGVKFGLGDIGIVTTIFHSSKLPSQGLASVTPFISVNAGVVAKAIDEIANEFPTIKKEFAKQNQVYLASGVVLDSYQMFSNEPITSIADLNGTKVAGAGLNLRYIQGIDGVAGVRAGLTDFYNMIDTGLVSKAMIWPEAAKTFKIAEVAPYMLKANFGAVNTKAVTVNQRFWNKLPNEVKVALKDVAVAYRDHLASTTMQRAQTSIDGYVAAGGKIIEISDKNRKDWAYSMPNIAVEWALYLDAKGEPGSEMLRAYLAKLKASGQISVRDWAAELNL